MNLNWQNIKDLFPYPLEIPTIFSVVQAELEYYQDYLKKYPLLVNPFGFMLAIRKQENGKKGREFGIMHAQALDTGLVTQAEWAMATIVKDTRRWHEDVLICVGGKSRDDFVDWIEYFGTKYCPIGASNDPKGLNKNWIPNVRRFYKEFIL